MLHLHRRSLGYFETLRSIKFRCFVVKIKLKLSMPCHFELLEKKKSNQYIFKEILMEVLT